MIKNNKLGNVTFIFAVVFISILGFFVIFNNFINLQDSIVKNSDDILCRALVGFKDLSKPFGFFLYELNNKCKVDTIKNVDLSKHLGDPAFRKIAVEMNRCWYRYGEGKFDFLSNWDTEGSWCFECGSINFKDNSANYNFKDYVDWTTKNYFSKKDERNKISFYNLTNLKYTKISDNEITKVREEFNNLINDPNGESLDDSLVPMVKVLGSQLELLNDLRTKSISAQDKKIFVVYRYNRVSKSLKDQLDGASSGAVKGVLAGALISIGAEMAVEATIYGVAGFAFGGIGAIPGVITGTIIGFIKGTYKTITASYKITKKLTKIATLSKKIKNLIKTSKSIEKPVEKISFTISSGKAIEISKKIVNFKATTKEIKSFAEIAKKAGDINTAKNLKILVKWMDELGISNLAKIDKKILNNKRDLTKIEKFIKDNQMYSELSIRGGKGSGLTKPIIDEIGDLNALRSLAKSEIKRIKNGDIVEPIGIKNYLRASLVIGGGIAGAYLGKTLNSNYQQYVDLMTREQYFRTCGTLRYPNK